MKFYIYTAALLLVHAVLYAQGPGVENVRFEQRTDGSLLVDIYYDITDAGNDSAEIVIEASADSADWTLPCTRLTGNVGKGVPGGPDRHAVWDFNADNPDVSGDFQVRVTAFGRMTDIDGNAYRTIWIGDRVWTAENLRVTHYRDGDPVPDIPTAMEWSGMTTGCRRSVETGAPSVSYGQVYNWYAVTDGRWLAPEGWHVPSDQEWKNLEMALGMSPAAANSQGRRGTDEGGELKKTGTVDWASPNTGATNESGFSAVPGGYCTATGITIPGNYYTYFWATSEGENSAQAWYRRLDYNESSVMRGCDDKNCGCAVRLIKNPGTETVLDSIHIDQSKQVVISDTTLEFTCTAFYSDGSILDVTSDAVWSVSPGIAGQIDAAGLFTPADTTGIATVTVSFQDRQNTVIVYVIDEDASDRDKLIGTWQAIKEATTIQGLGTITVTPQSDLFVHLIMNMRMDSTVIYESWTGPDKTQPESGYENGSGTWSQNSTGISLNFYGFVIEGQYQFITLDEIEFNAEVVVDDFGPEAIPVTIWFERDF
ncbi:fibrobacter succinogenes major paralogous domain-containing protein [bacterium]|nr:fibrobacter succinogenes major paralogous domain-containing protein [bacterium]